MSEAELEEVLKKIIEQTGASSMRDMGKVMGVIKPQAQGRADMGAVSKLVKAKLTS